MTFVYFICILLILGVTAVYYQACIRENLDNVEVSASNANVIASSEAFKRNFIDTKLAQDITGVSTNQAYTKIDPTTWVSTTTNPDTKVPVVTNTAAVTNTPVAGLQASTIVDSTQPVALSTLVASANQTQEQRILSNEQAFRDLMITKRIADDSLLTNQQRIINSIPVDIPEDINDPHNVLEQNFTTIPVASTVYVLPDMPQKIRDYIKSRQTPAKEYYTSFVDKTKSPEKVVSNLYIT